jgi:hypothetical protein
VGGLTIFDFSDHGGEDRNGFAEFLMKHGQKTMRDLAVFDEKFKPELGLIGFLEQHLDFGVKLGVAATTARFSSMGGNGGA